MRVTLRQQAAVLSWLVASLIVSPLVFLPLFPGAGYYDNHRLIEISCVLIALMVIAWQWAKGMKYLLPLDRPIAILLSLFFLCGLLSSGLAYSPRHALFEWANLALLLGLAWLIASEVNSRGDVLLDRLLMAAGSACAVYITIEVAIYLGFLRKGVQPSPFQLIVGYDNYRFFNYVQTISLPLLGLLAVRMRESDRRLFWWGVTSLWWMLLFVGLGRGALIGQVAGVTVTLILLRRAAIPWCRTMFWAGLVGLVAYLFVYALIPVLFGMAPFGLFFSGAGRSLESPTSGRIVLWKHALEMIQTNPWLGAGPAHFAHYALAIPDGTPSPHNWLLQVASEWGLPALLALLGAVGLAVHRLLQLRVEITRQDQDTLTALLVTGIAILVDGLVSGLIVMPLSQLWIALYIGCAWGWAASRVSQSKRDNRRILLATRVLSVPATALLIYIILRGVWPEVQERAHRPPQSNEAVYWPRILGDGRF